MSTNYTEIVYILDRSGSMGGLEADTIGGFNSMMDRQKKTGEKALVSTVLFDNECEVLTTSGTSTSTQGRRTGRPRPFSSSPRTGWRTRAAATPTRKCRRW